MAKKKSKAQITRMKKRAEARGEEYVAPPQNAGESTSLLEAPAAREQNELRTRAATKLLKELESIESNQELKSKERRSAKRKAEAIASEQAGCTAQELLEWYETHGRQDDGESTQNETKKRKESNGEKKKNPYIVFVGQLSYDTTADSLFNHIRNELGKEHEVTKETVQIRILTDSKTKKSRGMGFVEVSDPELLYALLKLHHTHLDGRRINIERTAGGGKNSEARKNKLSQMRKEQEQYMSDTVDKLLSQHLSAGELEEKELDEGVISLCKRHSPAVVEAALIEYIEKGGRDLDNPSAYLTFLIGKMATEGIDDPKDKKERAKRGRGGQGRGPRDSKRPRHHGPGGNTTETELGVIGSKLQESSAFAQSGIDMSASAPSANDRRDISKIFPSARRGRGRGYM